MEQTKMSIFDRFDLISHIMPYYAQTHKAFLLLSSLCLASRSKLDEYYEEFINCMKQNCLCISNSESNLDIPSDLFILNIMIADESKLDIFIRFIKNLAESSDFVFYPFEHTLHLIYSKKVN